MAISTPRASITRFLRRSDVRRADLASPVRKPGGRSPEVPGAGGVDPLRYPLDWRGAATAADGYAPPAPGGPPTGAGGLAAGGDDGGGGEPGGRAEGLDEGGGGEPGGAAAACAGDGESGGADRDGGGGVDPVADAYAMADAGPADGGGDAVGGGGIRLAGASAPAARAATMAAPRATACLGCASTATGRPSPERAAAEVVDRHDGPLVDPLVRGVRDGGGLRLGDQDGARQPGDLRGLVEQVALVRPPVGRVGEHDRGGPLATTGAHDAVDDPSQEPARQDLGRDAGTADEQRGGVAEPPLELPGDALRIGDGVAFGRIARHEPAVGLEAEHRGHGGPPFAESDHLGPAPGRPLVDGRSRVCGSEIDAEVVAHGVPR
jgi:hypothetical protein